jgi:hypothetical protein
MSGKTAMIAGGFGVIGRNLLHHLEGLEDWEIVGCPGARPTSPPAPASSRSDRQATRERLSGLREASHVSYCAFHARPSWGEHNAANLAMLVKCGRGDRGRLAQARATSSAGSTCGPSSPNSLPLGEVQTIRLAEFMADTEPVWQYIVERHVPAADAKIAAWPFADSCSAATGTW